MLKMLLDFFPLLAFFISYKLADIYTAVAVLMIATTIQTVGNRLISGKWQKLHLIGLAIALVFGSLTLALHDDRFIKWKVTVFFWLLAIVFIAGTLLRRSPLKALFESMNEQSLPVPTSIWTRLDISWGLVSASIGIANLYIAFNFPLDTWVNFKVWGITLIQILLFVYTGFAIYRFLPQEEVTAVSDAKSSTPTIPKE